MNEFDPTIQEIARRLVDLEEILGKSMSMRIWFNDQASDDLVVVFKDAKIFKQVMSCLQDWNRINLG